MRFIKSILFFFLVLGVLNLLLRSMFLFKSSKFTKRTDSNEQISRLIQNTNFIKTIKILNIKENDTSDLKYKFKTKNHAANKSMKSIYFKPNKTETKQIVNKFDFKYILRTNESLCKVNSNLLMIALVTVSPVNFRHRNVIRSTWATSHNQLNKHFRVVFIIGQSLKRKVNDAIHLESKQNGDIVQFDFIDSYYNLTTKTIMGFRWASTYCSNAKYTLKVDDDVVVNIDNLLAYLNRVVLDKNYQTNKMMCRFASRQSPIRNKKSKYYLSEKEYPNKTFDPFCLGPAYIFTMDLSAKFSHLASFTPKIKLEDVYVGVGFFYYF